MRAHPTRIRACCFRLPLSASEQLNESRMRRVFANFMPARAIALLDADWTSLRECGVAKTAAHMAISTAARTTTAEFCQPIGGGAYSRGD